MLRRWFGRQGDGDEPTHSEDPATHDAGADSHGPPQEARILRILDDAAAAFTFPMLDNGYVYLAATRLSLHRSDTDWALVTEVFGFSPRAGDPDLCVSTFASRLHDRSTEFTTRQALERHLAQHPYDEQVFTFPIDGGDWQDPDDLEVVAPDATSAVVRGTALELPGPDAYAALGIELVDPPRIQTYELCRYLAAVARDDVLATQTQRRAHVPPDTTEILVLDEWHHPNLVIAERPSGSETFQQLARVLATGDVAQYRPTLPPNTHWSNWPDGGTL